MTSGKYSGGPDGDLRLVPDLSALVPLPAQPGWACGPRWTGTPRKARCTPDASGHSLGAWWMKPAVMA